MLSPNSATYISRTVPLPAELGGSGAILSTNSATYTSPGHRPGFEESTVFSPVGAGHRAAAEGLGRPFRACVIFATGDQGRCPGLGWGRAFGPQEAEAEGEAWLRVPLTVPSTMAAGAKRRRRFTFLLLR